MKCPNCKKVLTNEEIEDFEFKIYVCSKCEFDWEEWELDED